MKYMSNICYEYVIYFPVVRNIVCYVTVITFYHYYFQILQTDHNNINLIYDRDMIIYTIYLFQIKLNVYIQTVQLMCTDLVEFLNRLFKYVKLIHSL